MENRIESLEIKMMELENTVEKLNQIITNQYRIIDKLESGYQIMAERLTTLSDSQRAEDQHQLPPHY